MPTGPSTGIVQSCPEAVGLFGFDIVVGLSTRRQRFTCVHLFDSYLTEFSPPFPSTLTTRALYPRSSWWFGARSCKPTPKGLPSSPVKHRKRRYTDAHVLGTPQQFPFRLMDERMPQSRMVRWNSWLQYWLPRSLWKITPCPGRRRNQAIRKASWTRLVCMCGAMLQPTTWRLNKSMTAARYNPSPYTKVQRPDRAQCDQNLMGLGREGL